MSNGLPIGILIVDNANMTAVRAELVKLHLAQAFDELGKAAFESKLTIDEFDELLSRRIVMDENILRGKPRPQAPFWANDYRRKGKRK